MMHFIIIVSTHEGSSTGPSAPFSHPQAKTMNSKRTVAIVGRESYYTVDYLEFGSISSSVTVGVFAPEVVVMQFFPGKQHIHAL